jgi:hypothetical protein
MNARLQPDVLLRALPSGQAELPLAADGVARWVWESRWGPMLIEVKGDQVYVNGGRVVPLSDLSALPGRSGPPSR